MLQIKNPTTEEIIQELATDSQEQIKQKYQAARQACKQIKKLSLEDRQNSIKQFAKLLQENINSLAQVLSQEMGKPIRQAQGEIKGLGQRINFFLEQTKNEIAPRHIHKSNTSTQQQVEEIISYEPLGVIANISAWNYPYFVGGNVFIPALLCGNCVLYKPSEYASLTGLEIAKLFDQTSLPPNSFQVIIGDGQSGRYLLEQKIDGVFFTGSYNTGKKIAESAATKMIRLQLELGGKDPAYVHDDVDVAIAASGLAEGSFFNNGQSCCAIERIYVHQSIYTEFLNHFINTVKSFVVGDPRQENTFLGPLTRQEQITVLEDQIKDALQKGAELCLGGKSMQKIKKGYYFEPTILTNTNHQMKVMREESFGPIIGIQKVRDQQEGLALMQDTDYGLTAAVYTKDKKLAENILTDLPVGSAYWNVCDRVSPHLPWSGCKHSGLGTTLALEGIRSFVRPKAWHCGFIAS